MADWIDKAQKRPNWQHADPQGCVMAWHKYQGCIITGWRRARDSEFITHWQRCPEGPYTPDYLPSACGKARVRIETGEDERS